MSNIMRAGPSRGVGAVVSFGQPPISANEDVSDAPSNQLVMLTEPRGLRAEAIRALRTHVVAQHVNEGKRALAICAPSENVGCSFVASNLAVALSQIGIKTLLLDADLRNPAVQSFFPGVRGAPGLQQCLASPEVSFAEGIENSVLPNLSVMCAGGVATSPQELLAGERFRELINVCLRDFDATVVDTPPANRSADARRISNVVGYSLVVARKDHTLIDDVKTLVKELRDDHAHVVGTVLNEA